MKLSKQKIKEIKKSSIKNLKFNKGYFGEFHLISKDKGIKIITNPNTHFRFHFNLDEFKPLTEIKVNGVSLPEEIYYDEDGNFKGYKTQYFEGKKLTKVVKRYKNISNSTAEKYFDTLYNKILELTENNILIYDIQPHNIIVNDKELNIIDCDFFKCPKDQTATGLYINNMFELYLGINRIKNKKVKKHIQQYYKELRSK